MKTKIFLFALLISISLISCKDDETIDMVDDDPISQTDDGPMTDDGPNPTEVLAMEREENITTLTAGGEKVWRIESAVLTNTNGSFDISANFNIKDDEFIFMNMPLNTGKSITEFEGTLDWRPGFVFDIEAVSEADAITELYLNGTPASFDFLENSSTQIQAFNSLTFTIEGDGLTAIWDFGDGRSMNLVLVEKLESDYKQVPTTTLSFSEAFTFESNGIEGGAAGMVGSLGANSFYLAVREDALNNGAGSPERIIKFDLSSGQKSEKLNFNSDFVSKQPSIIDDQLFVAGGQRINTYDLGLVNDPIASPDYATALGVQFLGLSRFGTAVLGDNIYLVGGDLDNVLSDKIFIYDTQSQIMTEFATMPEPRSGARAEIVNDKLYIFGGTTAFFSPPPKDTIYIYDLNTAELTIQTMPIPLNFTYTGKTENLIYVGGRIDSEDSADREPFIGVYDTRTGSFTEMQSNLESPENETIHSMAVFDGKLYVIFGRGEQQTAGELQTWSVLSTDI